MAEGSIGRLVQYAGPKNSPVISDVYSILASWPTLDWTRIQHFAESLGKGSTAEMQVCFQDTLLWISSTMMKARAAGSTIPQSFQSLTALYAEVPLARWLQICDTLSEHFIRVQTGNLDKRYLVMGAFTVFENNV
jgi:hypothetical protein